MKPAEEKQQVLLTKKQYLALLKVVYLGNWMANAHRSGIEGDARIEEYEAIEDYIFSLAPQFDLEKYVDHQKHDGKSYYPTWKFQEETKVHTVHAEYDEETFWDEVCDRIGERDFERKYSLDERMHMTPEEHFIKLRECIILWEEEMEEFGLERLEVLKTLKDLGFGYFF